MKQSHERKAKRVAEPVQVYLDPPDRLRLERLSAELDATKSDVLRRALEALEQQLMDPEAHPALRMIGLGGGHRRRPSPRYDVATGHDRYLADEEIASWKRAGARKRGG
jgi:Arc/MetJ-type ribon-helix-helix transcriptional regulator